MRFGHGSGWMPKRTSTQDPSSGSSQDDSGGQWIQDPLSIQKNMKFFNKSFQNPVESSRTKPIRRDKLGTKSMLVHGYKSCCIKKYYKSGPMKKENKIEKIFHNNVMHLHAAITVRSHHWTSDSVDYWHGRRETWSRIGFSGCCLTDDLCGSFG